jgi:hypothetical protein
MKKSLIVMVAMLGVTLTTKAQVIVSGKFVDAKATFRVYEMQEDSTFAEISANLTNNAKPKHRYAIELEENKVYVVKFINEDDKTKSMKFISYQSGEIDLDVNFKTTKDAYVTIKNNKAYVKRTNEKLLAVN